MGQEERRHAAQTHGSGRMVVTVKSRSLGEVAELIRNTKSDKVSASLTLVLWSLTDRSLTIPFDNGKEFVGYVSVVVALQPDIIFARPYST